MRYEFVYDPRLGIKLPVLYHDWDAYSVAERAEMVAIWEEIRARIPDRIRQLEAIINEKQQQLEQEEDFAQSCRLTREIAELASTINDLNIWFRVDQDVTAERVHR